jgi:hypothetical protein
MVALQGFDDRLPVLSCSDSFNGGRRCRRCRDIRHFILDCRFSDIRIVIITSLADRRINNQMNLPVLNRIDNIRPTFVKLQNRL